MSATNPATMFRDAEIANGWGEDGWRTVLEADLIAGRLPTSVRKPPAKIVLFVSPQLEERAKRVFAATGIDIQVGPHWLGSQWVLLGSTDSQQATK